MIRLDDEQAQPVAREQRTWLKSHVFPDSFLDSAPKGRDSYYDRLICLRAAKILRGQLRKLLSAGTLCGYECGEHCTSDAGFTRLRVLKLGYQAS